MKKFENLFVAAGYNTLGPNYVGKFDWGLSRYGYISYDGKDKFWIQKCWQSFFAGFHHETCNKAYYLSLVNVS